MTRLPCVLVAATSLLFAAAGSASAQTCSGTWETGGRVLVTFLKAKKVKFCERGRCETTGYRQHGREIIGFLRPSDGVSVVIDWMGGKYLISKKASRIAMTVYAPLTYRK